MYRIVAAVMAVVFSVTAVCPPEARAAQLALPPPGVRVSLSPEFVPVLVKGLKVNPQNPFKFEFIVDSGHTHLTGAALQNESTRVIKYFLASLTTPEKDLWVNLSPYERDRIVPDSFGVTEMGRDILAQDYLLKQITASLLYPEEQTGQDFWQRVYQEAYTKYGTTDIPLNTFNKVWVVPQKAVVYENGDTAFVVQTHLKVMLEEDYVALSHQRDSAESLSPDREVALSHQKDPASPERNRQGFAEASNAESLSPDREVALSHQKDPASPERNRQGFAEASSAEFPADEDRQKAGINKLGSRIVRELIIPKIEQEVNEGKNFAALRQVYHSLILANWYKKKLKDSLLSQVYIDKRKVAGVDVDDKEVKQKIYQQYLEAFQKGVYNYIKEDIDPATHEVVPRKYVSGGINFVWNMEGDVVQVYDTSNVPPGVVDTLNAQFANAGPNQVNLTEVNLQKIDVLPDGQKKAQTIAWTTDQTLPAKETNSIFETSGDRAMMAAVSVQAIANFLGRFFKANDAQTMVETVLTLEQDYKTSALQQTIPNNSQDMLIFSRLLQKKYDAIVAVIETYRKAVGSRNSPLEKVFYSYLANLQNIHGKMQAMAVVYADLMWPRSSQEGMDFESIHRQAQDIWTDWQKTADSSQRSELGAALEILRFKQRRDSQPPNSAGWFDADYSLKEITRDSIRSYAAIVTGHELGDLFRRVLFEVSLLETDSSDGIFDLFKNRRIQAMLDLRALSQDERRIIEEKLLQRADAIAGADIARAQRRLMVTRAVAKTVWGVMAAGLLALAGDLATPPKAPVKTADGSSQKEKADTSSKADNDKATPQQLQAIVDRLALPDLKFPEMAGTNQPSAQEIDLQSRLAVLQSQLSAMDAHVQTNQVSFDAVQQKIDEGFAEIQRIAQTKTVPESKVEPPQMPTMEQWNNAADQRQTAERPRPAQEHASQSSLSDVKNPILPNFPDDMEVSPQVSMGLNPVAGESVDAAQWLAIINGNFSYLATSSSYQLNRTSGEFSTEPRKIVAKPIGKEPFTESVTIPSRGKNQLLLPVPPNYVVVGVETQNKVDFGGLYLDEANQSWFATFHDDPGLVRFGVRPATDIERPRHSVLDFVDDKHEPLSQAAVEEAIKKDMPPALFEFLKWAQAQSLEDRRKIQEDLQRLGLFYYTSNPLFRARYDASNPLMRFTYNALSFQCSGACAMDQDIAHMLRLDEFTQFGFAVEGRTVYGAQRHAFNADARTGVPLEATSYAGMTSPLFGRANVTTEDWEKDHAFALSRAKTLLENLPGLLWSVRFKYEREQLAELIGTVRAQVEAAKVKRQQEAARSSQDAAREAYQRAIDENTQAQMDLIAGPKFDEPTAQKILGFVEAQLRDLFADLERIHADERPVPEQYRLMVRFDYLANILSAVDFRTVVDTELAVLKPEVKRVASLASRCLLDLSHLNEPLGRPFLFPKPNTTFEGRAVKDFDTSNMVLRPDTLATVVKVAPDVQAISDYVVRELDGKTMIFDTKSNFSVRIPDGAVLLDAVDGVFLIGLKDGKLSLVGPKVANYTPSPAGDYTVDDVGIQLIKLPFKDGDWLAVLSNKGKSKNTLSNYQFIGPVARKLGIEGQRFEGTFGKFNRHDIKIINGELIIRIPSIDPVTKDLNGKHQYVGSLAEKLGIAGQLFASVYMPTELSNGKIVLPVRHAKKGQQDEWIEGPWEFLGDGAEAAGLKGKTFEVVDMSQGVGVYSKGRWATIVSDGATAWLVGKLDDPELEQLKVPVTGNVGVQGELQRFILLPEETPEGALVCYVKDRQFIGAWKRLHWSDYDLNRVQERIGILTRPDKLSLPKFFSHMHPEWWVMEDENRVHLSPALRQLIGAETADANHITFYPSPNGEDFVAVVRYDHLTKLKLIHRRTTVYPVGQVYAEPTVKYLPSGEWLSVQKVSPSKIDLGPVGVNFVDQIIGPWSVASDVSSWLPTAAHRIDDPVFAKHPSGDEEAGSFIITYQTPTGEKKATGPIAQTMGLTDQTFKDIYAQSLPDGNVVVFFIRQGEDKEQWLAQRPLHDFAAHMAARHDLWMETPSGLEHAVPEFERIDIAWSYMNQQLQKELIGHSDLRSTFSSTIDLMLRQPDPQMNYYNQKQVSDILSDQENIPKFQSLLAGFLEGDYFVVNQFFEMLTAYNLQHLIPVYLGVVQDDSTAKTWKAFRDLNWLSVAQAYEQFVMKETWLEHKGIYLSPFYFSPSQTVEKINDFFNATLREIDPKDAKRLAKFAAAMDQLNTQLNKFGTEFPRRTIEGKDVAPLFVFLHDHVLAQSENFPFDAEVSRETQSDPIYAIARLIHSQWTSSALKINSYPEHAKWMEVNDKLNSVLGSAFMGTASLGSAELAGSIIKEAARDGGMWFVVITMIAILMRAKADRLRTQDKLVGRTVQGTIDQFLGKKDWAEGLGEAIGVREVVDRIMTPGRSVTDEDRRQLEALRQTLTLEQNVLVDALLALAFASPGKTIQEASGGLLSGDVWSDPRRFKNALIELARVATPLAIPREFADKQAMNKEVVDIMERFADGRISAAELRTGVRDVQAKYQGGAPVSGVADDDQRPLTFEALYDRVSKAFDGRRVRRPQGVVYSDRFNGSVQRRDGSSLHFDRLREVQTGESVEPQDARYINDRLMRVIKDTDRQISAPLVIDLQAAQGRTDEWIAQLVDSVKAMFVETSEGSKDQADYQPTHVFLLMPEGGVQESREMNVVLQQRHTNPKIFMQRLLKAIRREFQQAQLSAQTRQSPQQGPAFNNPQDQRLYVERNRLAQNQDAGEGLDRLRTSPLFKNEFTRENVFLVGLSPQAQQRFAGLFPKARMFVYENGQPKALRAARSFQAKPRVGQSPNRADAAMLAAQEALAVDDFDAVHSHVLQAIELLRTKSPEDLDDNFHPIADNIWSRDLAIEVLDVLSEEDGLNTEEDLLLGLLKQTADGQALKTGLGYKNADGSNTVGGIDLSRSRMDLEIRNESASPLFTLDPARLSDFQFDGLSPVIIRMTPIQDLPVWLGLNRRGGGLET